jgi:hypothetical protein
VLDEEMLESSPGRVRVEATLRELVDRGLLSTERAINAGLPRRSDGERVYEGHWWCLTKAGRAAIGRRRRCLSPPRELICSDGHGIFVTI